MSVRSSIERLNTIKARIRTNLVAQGITVPEDTVLSEMAEQILSVAGEDGRGIVSIKRTSGTGAAGTTDTYTITYSDATTSTFKVYNGKDGTPYTLTSADKTAIATEAAGMVDISGKLDKSGGTLTGKLVAQTNTNYTTRQVRNVIYLEDGASVPTTQNGDLVLFYK